MTSENISTITIRNGDLNRETQCSLRWLGAGDIPMILCLQDEVASALSGHFDYYPQTEHELQQMFECGGISVGSFVDGMLIGFHTAVIPGRTEDNLGFDIGLTGDELDLVAHLENSSVHPSYRGNGLQQRMAAAIIRNFEENGRYRYLCETAAPDNVASIRSTLANRLWIVDLKVKYGGFLRYLFLRDLMNPYPVKDTIDLSVSASDFDAQQLLFAQRYYAVAYERIGQEHRLSFIRDLR